MTITGKYTGLKLRMKTLKCLALAVICLAPHFSPAIFAATFIKTWSINVRISNPIGLPAYKVTLLNQPYSIGASVSSTAEAPIVTADIYLGVITPTKSTLTWIMQGDSATLQSGLEPLITGVNLSANESLDTGILLGKDILQTFTGTESRGMYTIFAILVSSGEDPSNSDNWLVEDMTPLFL